MKCYEMASSTDEKHFFTSKMSEYNGHIKELKAKIKALLSYYREFENNATEA